MRHHLKNAAWIAAFVLVGACWGYEVIRASTPVPPRNAAGIWICPILGECGPAGTPGLGRW